MENALELLQSKFQSWVEGAVSMLPNIGVAVVVFVVFWLLSRLARRAVLRGSAHLAERENVSRLIAATVGLGVLFVGLFVALGVMQLDKTVTSLLAGAGVLGLSLGFALQALMTNYIAGTLISFRGTYKEGDLIEADGHFGKVEAIDLRVTRLRVPTGETVLIPNKEIFENSFVNYSETGEHRVDLDLGVSYADDLETAEHVAREALDGVAARIPERDVDVFFTEFGDSAIGIRVRFWVPFQSKKSVHAARSDAIVRLKKAFDAADLSIPFPIRTVDFGIRGGTPLNEMLSAS